MTAESVGPRSVGSVEPRSAGFQTPRVVLIGKPDCHLCDVARRVVEQVCGELGVAWEERSIFDDPALADQYWELIPVTLVDGRQLAVWTVDPDQLRAALG